MSKKTRASLRRTLLTLSLVLVVAFAAVGGTIAWLTATTGVVSNTFTVGDIKIDLDEAKVDVYGVEDTAAARQKTNAYKLMPGHTYTKDPTVHVLAASEPCYVFVKVVNGISGIEATTNTIAAQLTANGWVALSGQENVYYYAGTTNENSENFAVKVNEAGAVDALAAQKNLVVFEQFIIDDDAVVSTYKDTDTKITVDAYAVQADGSTSAADAWTKAPATWEN